MKLNHWSMSGLALVAVALGCGCSSGSLASQPARAATITSADSLGIVAPPKVGRAHYVVGDEVGGGGGATSSVSSDEIGTASPEGSDRNELGAPKEPRRSDEKRRGGGFGAAK